MSLIKRNGLLMLGLGLGMLSILSCNNPANDNHRQVDPVNPDTMLDERDTSIRDSALTDSNGLADSIIISPANPPM
ncbi:hypothetical protein [Sphingobacterium sp.]|uniref:hypothetical protein n=1 Tax=Sphingobacterium sp. TaxID=341027 RepID=UPI00289EA82C|nr:hypothetical protein [Sphingobacterium sp.]